MTAGLDLEEATIADLQAAMASGAETAKSVGDVRSGAQSPRLGAIALAMVRREIEPGTVLTASWEGGSREGRVVRLPFPV